MDSVKKSITVGVRVMRIWVNGDARFIGWWHILGLSEGGEFSLEHPRALEKSELPCLPSDLDVESESMLSKTKE